MPPGKKIQLGVLRVSHEDFGTEKAPLRSSMLKSFVECPMRYLHSMETEFIANDRMETGSAVHWLIEMHEQHKRPARAVDYKQAEKKWPKSDPDKVREYYLGYVKRRPEIEDKFGAVFGIETAFTAKIKAAKHDPTGKEIVITCTVDQIRRAGNSLAVIDFKVSTAAISDSVKTYALQLSAYMVAVLQKYPDHKVASYIMNPLLMSKPRSAFMYPSELSVEHADALLNSVRNQVAAIRAGEPSRMPNYGCSYCPKRKPSRC
jgi:hypothetical protein